MLLKGKKRGPDDSRKYFIRFIFKNKNKIEVLDTWSIEKIKRKYQIILAMVKGMIVTNVKEELVNNETIYSDYIYHDE
jgi:hypothetical protein